MQSIDFSLYLKKLLYCVYQYIFFKFAFLTKISALRIKFPNHRAGKKIIEILIWIKIHNVPLVSSIFIFQIISLIFRFYAADLRVIKIPREEKPCIGL